MSADGCFRGKIVRDYWREKDFSLSLVFVWCCPPDSFPAVVVRDGECIRIAGFYTSREAIVDAVLLLLENGLYLGIGRHRRLKEVMLMAGLDEEEVLALAVERHLHSLAERIRKGEYLPSPETLISISPLKEGLLMEVWASLEEAGKLNWEGLDWVKNTIRDYFLGVESLYSEGKGKPEEEKGLGEEMLSLPAWVDAVYINLKEGKCRGYMLRYKGNRRFYTKKTWWNNQSIPEALCREEYSGKVILRDGRVLSVEKTVVNGEKIVFEVEQDGGTQ